MWKDRTLGKNENLYLPQRATWLATGNNLRIRGDLPRRCYWIRMDAKTARPWERTGFKHDDLVSWVSDNRGRLLAALLTIVRAWHTAGRPPAAVPTFGGFERWAMTVGSILAYLGIPGFLEKREDGGGDHPGIPTGVLSCPRCAARGVGRCTSDQRGRVGRIRV